MADRILIQCPGCSAKLAISDESKLGKKIRCSKCSEVFVANALKARSGSTTSAPTKAAKPKPKKSDEDEFNFDDMEMEDKSANEEEDSEEESRPLKAKVRQSKKGAKGKGKKKSGGNMPLIIGGSVVAVLLLSVVGYFLFTDKVEPPPGVPPVAQQPAAMPAAQQQTAAAPVAQQPNAAAVSIAQQPAAEPAAQAESPITESPTGSSKLFPGLTAATLSSDIAGLPAGCSLNARACWKSELLYSKGRQPDFPMQLLLELDGAFLNNTCGFGLVEFKTIQLDSGEVLKPINDIFGNEPRPLSFIVPFIRDDKSSDSPPLLRIVIPFELPPMPATKLRIIEGSLVLRTFEKSEDITIDDVRSVAGNPLKHPSLKSSLLLYVSKSTGAIKGVTFTGESIAAHFQPGFMAGVIEVWDKDSPDEPPIPLIPQYMSDLGPKLPGGEIDTRNCERQPSLPRRIAMRLQLRSKFNDARVPFQFENVDLPKFDARPKR